MNTSDRKSKHLRSCLLLLFRFCLHPTNSSLTYDDPVSFAPVPTTSIPFSHLSAREVYKELARSDLGLPANVVRSWILMLAFIVDTDVEIVTQVREGQGKARGSAGTGGHEGRRKCGSELEPCGQVNPQAKAEVEVVCGSWEGEDNGQASNKCET